MAIPAYIRDIVRREGWEGLYDGLLSDTAATLVSKYVYIAVITNYGLLTHPTSFLYFYLYTFLRSALLRRRTHSSAPARTGKKTLPVLGVAEELGLGYVSGVLSRAISTPLNVVTIHLQTNLGSDDDNDPDGHKPQTFSDVIRAIYSDRGLGGFWKGEYFTRRIHVPSTYRMQASRPSLSSRSTPPSHSLSFSSSRDSRVRLKGTRLPSSAAHSPTPSP